MLEKSIKVTFETDEPNNKYVDIMYIDKDDARLLKLPMDEHKLILRYREFKRTIGLV